MKMAEINCFINAKRADLYRAKTGRFCGPTLGQAPTGFVQTPNSAPSRPLIRPSKVSNPDYSSSSSSILVLRVPAASYYTRNRGAGKVGGKPGDRQIVRGIRIEAVMMRGRSEARQTDGSGGRSICKPQTACSRDSSSSSSSSSSSGSSSSSRSSSSVDPEDGKPTRENTSPNCRTVGRAFQQLRVIYDPRRNEAS